MSSWQQELLSGFAVLRAESLSLSVGDSISRGSASSAEPQPLGWTIGKPEAFRNVSGRAGQSPVLTGSQSRFKFVRRLLAEMTVW